MPSLTAHDRQCLEKATFFAGLYQIIQELLASLGELKQAAELFHGSHLSLFTLLCYQISYGPFRDIVFPALVEQAQS